MTVLGSRFNQVSALYLRAKWCHLRPHHHSFGWSSLRRERRLAPQGYQPEEQFLLPALHKVFSFWNSPTTGKIMTREIDIRVEKLLFLNSVNKNSFVSDDSRFDSLWVNILTVDWNDSIWNLSITLNMMTAIMSRSKNPSPTPVEMMNSWFGGIMYSTRTSVCWRRTYKFSST